MWLPKTIPWLYANGRLKKAEAEFERIATWSKVELTEQDLEIFSNKKNVNVLCRKLYFNRNQLVQLKTKLIWIQKTLNVQSQCLCVTDI